MTRISTETAPVPADSAVPIEPSDQKREIFAATRHASLQNADHVITQLRGMLIEARQYRFRAGARVKVPLDLDDLHLAGSQSASVRDCPTAPHPACAVIRRVSEAAPTVRLEIPAKTKSGAT
jgi:hypothetical protein